MRAMAGLWKEGQGRIVRPPLEQMMFLPQQPYMTLGSLRDQLLYTMPDDAVRLRRATARRAARRAARHGAGARGRIWMSRSGNGRASSRWASSRAWPSPASCWPSRNSPFSTRRPAPSRPTGCEPCSNSLPALRRPISAWDQRICSNTTKCNSSSAAMGRGR